MTGLIFSDTEAAPAKINLSLEVLERRSDNYHNLQSLMVTIDLHDQLSLFLSSDQGGKWRVSSDDASVPEDENNIAYTAALAFFNYYGIDPLAYFLNLKIKKRIPSQAGLGGGSSDAAATIRLLERAFFPNGAFESMPAAYMAHEIGADVPYCYRGGTQFVSGIGDVLAAQEPFPRLPLILVTPPFAVSTKDAFAALNIESRAPIDENGAKLMQQYCEIIKDKNYSELQTLLKNSFYPYLLDTYPEIKTYCIALKDTGSPFVSLSGSGPTLFAIYKEDTATKSIARVLKSKFPLAHITESYINGLL